MTDHLKTIKEALEAGPTDGVWIVANDPSLNQYAISAEARGSGFGSSVAVATQRDDWKPLPHDEAMANAKHIAACNPAAMRSIVDRLEAAEKDAMRLQVIYENMEDDGHGFWNADFWIKEKIPGQKPDRETFERAIDAAMAGKEGGNG